MNFDSDTDCAVPSVIPTEKLRSETQNSKGNDHGPTVTTSQPSKEVIYYSNDSYSEPEIDLDIPQNHTLVLENSGHSNTQSTGSGHEVISVDAVTVTLAEEIRGPNCASTQLKEIPKARVSFASARTIHNLKQFIPLDPTSICQGFQEGGASSKKEDLKKGTYIMLIYGLLDKSVDTVGIQLQLLSQRRFGSFHFLESPSKILCLTQHKSLSLTIHRLDFTSVLI